MLILGKYHSQNIHEWENNQCCGFHPLKICSCNNNCPSTELKCEGKPYSSKFYISCKFHTKLFEIECLNRASAAESIIDKDLVKGHSNIPEARFSIIASMRPKGIPLERVHYETSTNIALLECNRSFMRKVEPFQKKKS